MLHMEKKIFKMELPKLQNSKCAYRQAQNKLLIKSDYF